MNKLEKLVYNVLKANPKVKFLVRNIYQSIFDLLPDKPNYFDGDLLIREDYFFGFHDISPFSADDRFLLANKINIPHRMPNNEDKLSVGYFNGSDFRNFNEIGSTRAWNYHKGCRLQWIGDSKEAIFNCYQNALVSNIINIETGKNRLIDWPIDTISPNQLYATSFSYSRLERLMPGYGYQFDDEDSYLHLNSTENTGLFLIDLKKNSRNKILSLDEIQSLDYQPEMKDANHFITHSLFSPDSKYISFLHRWVKDDVTKRQTRLIICSLDGKNKYISPTNGMVSHYVWNRMGNIIAFCNIKGVDSHVLFDDYTMEQYRRIAYPELNSDGHQHFDSTGKYFVTDTYPDKRRYARLFIVNTLNNKVKKIAEVKSPKKFQSIFPYKHWACDLHPRWSKSTNLICFDTVFTGKRSLAILKLNNFSI